MLALTRAEGETLRFPDLDVTIHFSSVRSKNLRVAIEAPRHIRVLRGELEDNSSPTSEATVSKRHKLRNELNTLNLAIYLYRRMVDQGQQDDAEGLFDDIVSQLRRLSSDYGLISESAPRRALLIDDDANELSLLAGLLRSYGYEVATARDGIEGLAYLESNPLPQVVLVDMRMPRCDGPTTIKRMREKPEFDTVRILGVSGCSPQEAGIKELDNAVEWFMKPVDPEALVHAIAFSA